MHQRYTVIKFCLEYLCCRPGINLLHASFTPHPHSLENTENYVPSSLSICTRLQTKSLFTVNSSLILFHCSTVYFRDNLRICFIAACFLFTCCCTHLVLLFHTVESFLLDVLHVLHILHCTLLCDINKWCLVVALVL